MDGLTSKPKFKKEEEEEKNVYLLIKNSIMDYTKLYTICPYIFSSGNDGEFDGVIDINV